jgi:hypothetical protein
LPCRARSSISADYLEEIADYLEEQSETLKNPVKTISADYLEEPGKTNIS